MASIPSLHVEERSQVEVVADLTERPDAFITGAPGMTVDGYLCALEAERFFQMRQYFLEHSHAMFLYNLLCGYVTPTHELLFIVGRPKARITHKRQEKGLPLIDAQVRNTHPLVFVMQMMGRMGIPPLQGESSVQPIPISEVPEDVQRIVAEKEQHAQHGP